MGLRSNISKASNRMGMDFPGAYWSIDDLRIGSSEGQVVFELNAYPSRESKQAFGTPLVPDFSFGAPEDMAVNSRLYSWQVSYPLAQVFPNGIPITEAAQKDLIYPILKEHLAAMGYVFEDVLDQ